MTPTQFVTQLSTLRFPDTFNPYADQCSVYDVSGAPTRRSELLRQMLDTANGVEIDAIWVGRDLGFRGGRRTGMALTDDVHFHDHLKRWGMTSDKPTLGLPVSERTATVVWDVLSRIQAPVFLWNVFPLHPHLPNAPFTNRMHNAKERRAGIEVLEQLVNFLRPKRLIAIGNDADNVLRLIAQKQPIEKVRHPSYGGQTEFTQRIQTLYKLGAGTLL